MYRLPSPIQRDDEGPVGDQQRDLTPVSTQTKNGLRLSTPIQRYQVSISKTNLTTSHGPGNLCSSPTDGKHPIASSTCLGNCLLPIGPEIPFPHLEAPGGSAWRSSLQPLKAPPAETKEGFLNNGLFCGEKRNGVGGGDKPRSRVIYWDTTVVISAPRAVPSSFHCVFVEWMNG